MFVWGPIVDLLRLLIFARAQACGCLGGLIQTPDVLAVYSVVRRRAVGRRPSLWITQIVASPDVVLALIASTLTCVAIAGATPASGRARLVAWGCFHEGIVSMGIRELIIVTFSVLRLWGGSSVVRAR